MVGVGFALQALADFLVGEHCHACGNSIDRSRSLTAPAEGAAAALTTPLRVGSRYAGVDTHPLCRACCRRLVPLQAPVRIGNVHHDGSVSLQSGGLLPPPSRLSLRQEFDLSVWAAFETDDRLLAVVHALKFARRERLAPWLARALAFGLPAAALHQDEHERVVAVPADRASMRRRGFNQAERLARAFAAESGATFLPGALIKARPTSPQSLLDGAARAHNVAGAFAVANNAEIRDRPVVLVDDLVTTGATAAVCAAALYAAGAREVRVACVGYRP